MDYVSWMRGKKMGKVIWTQQKELEMRCWVCTACKKTPFAITGASTMQTSGDFKRRHNCDSHNAALASLNLAEWKNDKNAPSVGCIYRHFPTQKFVLNLLEMLANSTIYKYIECLGTHISPPQKKRNSQVLKTTKRSQVFSPGFTPLVFSLDPRTQPIWDPICYPTCALETKRHLLVCDGFHRNPTFAFEVGLLISWIFTVTVMAE